MIVTKKENKIMALLKRRKEKYQKYYVRVCGDLCEAFEAAENADDLKEMFDDFCKIMTHLRFEKDDYLKTEKIYEELGFDPTDDVEEEAAIGFNTKGGDKEDE